MKLKIYATREEAHRDGSGETRLLGDLDFGGSLRVSLGVLKYITENVDDYSTVKLSPASDSRNEYTVTIFVKNFDGCWFVGSRVEGSRASYLSLSRYPDRAERERDDYVDAWLGSGSWEVHREAAT